MGRKHLHLVDRKKRLLKEIKDAAELIEILEHEIKEKLKEFTRPGTTYRRQTELVAEIKTTRKQINSELEKHNLAKSAYDSLPNDNRN